MTRDHELDSVSRPDAATGTTSGSGAGSHAGTEPLTCGRSLYGEPDISAYL